MARETSKQAFQEILESGALGESQKKVFQAIFELGEATGRELNQHLNSQSAHKRLSELHEMGLIREKKIRECRVTGHDSASWEVTGAMPKPVVKHPSTTPSKADFTVAVEKIRGLIAYYKRQNPSWVAPEELIRVGVWLKTKAS